MTLLISAYQEGIKAAATRAVGQPIRPLSPIVANSALLGGAKTVPAFDPNSLPALQAPTDPLVFSKLLGNQQTGLTALAPERKLASSICTTCRRDKHYGPCRQTQINNGEGVKLKNAGFNPGMYGDRHDSMSADSPATNSRYTSATTAESSLTRGRQNNPTATANTAFNDFSRFTQPADEWSNAYGALVKTCSRIPLTSYENRGPTVNPYEQEQPQFISPPVGMGVTGTDLISKAFDQFRTQFDAGTME